MNTVAIFGVGLIGGSFALALRQAGFSGRILGVSSPETVRKAIDLGVIDEGMSAEQATIRRPHLPRTAHPSDRGNPAKTRSVGASGCTGHRCGKHKKYYCESRQSDPSLPVFGRPSHGWQGEARGGSG